jgi:hypothetical protein
MFHKGQYTPSQLFFEAFTCTSTHTPHKNEAAYKGYFTPVSGPLAHSSMGSKYKSRLRKSKALQGRRRT